MIRLEDKSKVEHYLALAGPPPLSAYSFVSIYAWKNFFDFHLKVIDDCLCIFAENILGSFLYLPPLGRQISLETIKSCMDFLRQRKSDANELRLENCCLAQIPFFGGEDFVIEKKFHEYVYYRKELVDLSGQDYKAKRSLCNFFTQHYLYEYVPFKKEMAAECLQLYEQWSTNRKMKYPDELYNHMIEENYLVHKLIMENFEALEMVGRAVFINGKVKAYTFGYPVNDEVFCVFLEVADLAVKGLPVFIFRELCAEASLNTYRFINVMDDFGLPNLTQTKMSFHPRVLCPVYSVRQKFD